MRNVDARTAEKHFKEADALYREGRHAEALDRLIELDEAFPNTPNVLLPLARCLRHVGRVDEALAICDDLITHHGDLRAVTLREYILKSQPSGHDLAPQPQVHSIEGLNQDAHAGVLDDLLSPAPPPLPMAKIEERKPYLKYVVIGVAVLAVLLVVAPLVVRLVRGPAAPTPEAAVVAPADRASAEAPSADGGTGTAAAEMPQLSEKALLGILLLILVLGIAASAASLYLTLMITGHLPYETITDNLINTTLMSIAILLVLCVPCLGVIIAIYILHKTYDLGFLDFLILVGMNFATGFVFGIIMRLILFAAGIPLN